MSTPTPPPATPPAPPDPWKGLRGVMSAILVLESLAVLLALLVVTKIGDNGGPVGVTVVVALAVALALACRYLARDWGIPLIVGLQVALLACWLLSPAVGVLGVVFGLVWLAILLMRRDVARKMARGELPSQQCRPQG